MDVANQNGRCKPKITNTYMYTDGLHEQWRAHASHNCKRTRLSSTQTWRTVCVCQGERARQRVCLCVLVRERERERKREREWGRERDRRENKWCVSLCVCCVSVCQYVCVEQGRHIEMESESRACQHTHTSTHIDTLTHIEMESESRACQQCPTRQVPLSPGNVVCVCVHLPACAH